MFDGPTIDNINLVSSDMKTLLNKSVIIYKSFFCYSITVVVHIVVSVVLVWYFEFFMNYPYMFKTIQSQFYEFNNQSKVMKDCAWLWMLIKIENLLKVPWLIDGTATVKWNTIEFTDFIILIHINIRCFKIFLNEFLYFFTTVCYLQGVHLCLQFYIRSQNNIKESYFPFNSLSRGQIYLIISSIILKTVVT